MWESKPEPGPPACPGSDPPATYGQHFSETDSPAHCLVASESGILSKELGCMTATCRQVVLRTSVFLYFTSRYGSQGSHRCERAYPCFLYLLTFLPPRTALAFQKMATAQTVTFSSALVTRNGRGVSLNPFPAPTKMTVVFPLGLLMQCCALNKMLLVLSSYLHFSCTFEFH